MRNLKRVLSLALAAMMLIGMMVITSSAAESAATSFVDANEIANTEAVTIMNALGVLLGDAESGAFRPSDTLTREEAAVIICKMLLGPENVDTLIVTNDVFDDVGKDWWSAPYVQYCVNLGIISGNGDGTFDPEGQLTGAAFGKMLLVALGYNAQYQNYLNNDNWETLVSNDMRSAGISISGVNVTAPLSRDNAAQMAFQTLTAPMVYYANEGFQFTTPDGFQMVQTPSAAEKISATGKGYDGAEDGWQQFCEVFFPQLKKTSDTEKPDNFGRPGSFWEYKGDTICFTSDDAAAVFSSTTTFSKKDLYNALGKSVIGDIDVLTYWTDGVEDDNTDSWGIESLTSSASTTKSLGANGQLNEVYVTRNAKDDAYNVTVVTINTYLAQVSGDFNSSRETLNVSVKELTSTGSSTTKTLSLDDFANLDSFQDKDWVLVTVASGDVQTIELADTVTGTVDSVTVSTKVTMDGVAYNYSLLKTGTVDDSNIGNEIVLILDAYGYVIGTDNVTGSTSNYVFLSAFTKNSSDFDEVYRAQAYFTDGAKEVITISKVNKKNPSNVSGTDAIQADSTNYYAGWYTFTTTNSGAYEVVPATSTAANNTSTTASAVGESVTVTKHGDATIRYTGGTVSGNNSTVFLVLDNNKATTYTGVRNVPTILTNSTSSDTKIWIAKKGTYASYVFIDKGTADLSDTGTETGDHIVILSTTPEISGSGNNRVSTYEAIVNGDYDVTVTTTNTLGRGLYADVTYNDKGQVTNKEPVSGTTNDARSYSVAGKTVSFEGGVLEFDGNSLVLSDDCIVLLIENDDEVTSTSPDSIASRFSGGTSLEGSIYAVLKNNIVNYLYVDVGRTIESSDITSSSATTADVEKAMEGGNTANVKADVTLTNVTVPADSSMVITGTSNTNKSDVTVSGSNNTIAGNMTVGNNGTLTVSATGGDDSQDSSVTIASTAKLTVEDGGELTVEDGQTLVVEGTMVVEGDLTVEGTITVAQDGILEVTGELAAAIDEGSVAITVNGTLKITGEGAISLGSNNLRAARSEPSVTLTISSTGKVTVEEGASLTVASSGSLVVNGTLTYETAPNVLPTMSGSGTVNLPTAEAKLDERYQAGYNYAQITFTENGSPYTLSTTAAKLAQFVELYNHGEYANDTGAAFNQSGSNWLSQLRGSENNKYINAGVTVTAPAMTTASGYASSVKMERDSADGSTVSYEYTAAPGGAYDNSGILHFYFGLGLLAGESDSSVDPSVGTNTLQNSQIAKVTTPQSYDRAYTFTWTFDSLKVVQTLEININTDGASATVTVPAANAVVADDVSDGD